MKALSSEAVDRGLGEVIVVDTAGKAGMPASGTGRPGPPPAPVTIPAPATAGLAPSTGCTATGLPDDLAIDADGTITGTVCSLGTHTVTITAPDGRGEARTATFDWIVL